MFGKSSIKFPHLILLRWAILFPETTNLLELYMCMDNQVNDSGSGEALSFILKTIHIILI
jgi:hypothetical protein